VEASDFFSDNLAPKTAKTLEAEKLTKAAKTGSWDFSTNGLLKVAVPTAPKRVKDLDFSTSALLAE
jgi:hypothetical protein